MIHLTYMWLREDGTPYYVGKDSTGLRAHRYGSPPSERVITQDWPSEKDALSAEVFLISYYGRKDNGTGFLRNQTDGGEGLINPSPETRRKIGLAQKTPARVALLVVRNKTEAHRLLCRKKRTGFRFPPEFGEKVSRSMMGSKHALGSKRPDVSERNKQRLKGKKHSPDCKHCEALRAGRAWVTRRAS